MKPKNFPARKLERQIAASRRAGGSIGFAEAIAALKQARQIRTKKDRRS